VSVAVTAILVLVMAGTTLYLIGSMILSIRREKKTSGLRGTWANFGLSIAFCTLFLVSWAAQGLAQWQVFVQDQHEHGEPVKVIEFVQDFSQATLENWQSEFLQLFSFVVLAALLVHKGSAESKDSDDRMEQQLQRIEKRLDEIAPKKA
jgi:hypothetical protein